MTDQELKGNVLLRLPNLEAVWAQLHTYCRPSPHSDSFAENSHRRPAQNKRTSAFDVLQGGSEQTFSAASSRNCAAANTPSISSVVKVVWKQGVRKHSIFKRC